MASAKPRGILIAGNWKMNFLVSETTTFFSDLSKLTEKAPVDGVEAVLIPPMLSLERAVQLAQQAPFKIEIAAQNVHWEKKGAFTGEVSGPMIQELGIKWALVGHSERRQYFGETDETARKRAESLLAQGLRVILCIGETRIEREANQTQSVLSRQMTGALPKAGVGAAAYLDGRLVLAYEPVWAIGTGLTATPAQAEEAHGLLRSILEDRFGKEASAQTPILYGGSVTPENVDSLLACPNVDGALVGGASLKPASYLALLVAGHRALNS